MTRTWHEIARPEQLPPDNSWNVFCLLAGRGFGKTRAAAEWIADQAATMPNTTWAVMAPTWRDVRQVCFRTIHQVLSEVEILDHNAGDCTTHLRNGSRILGFSADRPERLNGLHPDGAWVEELDSFQLELSKAEETILAEVHHDADLARRIVLSLVAAGVLTEADALRTQPAWQAIRRVPRVFVSTSQVRDAGPGPALESILASADPKVIVRRGSTWDNESHLSRSALSHLRARYGVDHYSLNP